MHKIEGTNYISKIVNVTQEPIGRTPRSNPATYIKVFEGYPYTYAMKCDCKNGRRLSKYIPTAAEVGLSNV